MGAEVTEINLKKANPALVSQLKRMLEYAEEGSIVGICGAAYYHDGSTAEHWMEPPDTYSESLTADRMQGCLSRLSFMLHCRALDIDICSHITGPPSEDETPDSE